MFLDYNRMMGVSLFPWGWHILSNSCFEAGRGISAETCGLNVVFPPDDIGSCPRTQFIIYVIEIRNKNIPIFGVTNGGVLGDMMLSFILSC